MAAGRYDFIIEQGATFGPKQFQYKDSNGDPIDITGYTVRAKIKKRASDPQELLDFTCTIQDAVNGIFNISLTATQTATLPTAFSNVAEKNLLQCVYDIELVTGSVVIRLVEGIVSISPEVTR
jgi:hypothetical protein